MPVEIGGNGCCFVSPFPLLVRSSDIVHPALAMAALRCAKWMVLYPFDSPLQRSSTMSCNLDSAHTRDVFFIRLASQLGRSHHMAMSCTLEHARAVLCPSAVLVRADDGRVCVCMCLLVVRLLLDHYALNNEVEED